MLRVDQRRHHAAERLDTERQRRHVEQQHVLDVALEDAALDGRADGDDFVRVDALVRLLAEELLHELLDLRHARRAADEHDLVDVRRLQPGIGKRLPDRRHRALQQVVDELLELRARQLHLQVLRPVLIGGDERQVDVGLHHGGELDLRLLRRFLQPLQRHPVLAQIDAVGLLELGDDPVDDPLIEIVAAEVRVAVGRLHLDDALADLENRDVEGAAAEVVHGNRFVRLLVEAVGERRGRRLVDDAQDVEAGDLAGVLRRLPLRVVEVGRHGDDRVGDLLAEIVLGGRLQLLQHHRGDLRRRILLAADLDPRVAVVRLHDLVRNARRLLGDLAVLPPHEPLDREHRVLGIRDRLPLRDLAHEPLAVLRESDDRRRGARAFLIHDDRGLPAFHDRDHRVGRAEVDSNDFAHVEQCSTLLVYVKQMI